MTKITHFLKQSSRFLRKQRGSRVRDSASSLSHRQGLLLLKAQAQGTGVPGPGGAGEEGARGELHATCQPWASDDLLLQTRRGILAGCPLLWQPFFRLTPAVGLGFVCLQVLAPPSTEPYRGHPVLPMCQGPQGEVFCQTRFTLGIPLPVLLQPQPCAVPVPRRRRCWDGAFRGYPQSLCESSTCIG